MFSKFTLLLWLHMALLGLSLKAQTISDFNTISLQPNSYWNGSDLSGGFNDGNAFFKNYYDTTYMSWDGFSVSNMVDTATSGFGNIYSAMVESPFQANSYAIVGATGYYGPTYLKLTGAATGKLVRNVMVTNSVMAYKSMKNGDSFSKKFGGANGTDPDWFMLTITGFNSGTMTDTVNFFLADYRSANSASDYILKDWTEVYLEKLGNVDSLVFSLSSTDNGSWGMNTPAYFCIDHFITLNSGTFISDVKTENHFEVYPNPTMDFLIIENGIEGKIDIQILNTMGILVHEEILIDKESKIDISNYPAGIYILSLGANGQIQTQKIIKK